MPRGTSSPRVRKNSFESKSDDESGLVRVGAVSKCASESGATRSAVARIPESCQAALGFFSFGGDTLKIKFCQAREPLSLFKPIGARAFEALFQSRDV